MTQDFTPTNARPDWRSHAVTRGPDRAAARSYLRAAGMADGDFDKPMIGIVNTWSTVTPCNMHLDRLAVDVRAGIIAAGGWPVDFNTIVVTDGISMGTKGMKASLISREVIADSIELAIEGHQLDGVICIVGCDKTIPAAAMALAWSITAAPSCPVGSASGSSRSRRCSRPSGPMPPGPWTTPG
jgi:dihydroxy-acid dehydratase